MSLAYGPRAQQVAPTSAADVTVTTWDGLPAVLTAPVTVDAAGQVSFTVATPDRYRVSVRVGSYTSVDSADLGSGSSDPYERAVAYFQANSGAASAAQPATRSQLLSYAATVTPDLSLGHTVLVGPLTGNLTLANPTNATSGLRFVLVLRQDGTGGRTVTWGSAFLDTDQPDPTAGSSSKFEFVYDAGLAKWI